MLPLAVSGGKASAEWGVTDRGLLLHSTNGGQTWSVANPASGVLGRDALGVTFAGASGWAVTSSGMFDTADAGATWTALPALASPPGDNVTVSWAQRVGASRGWAITNLNQLLMTSDGGQKWRSASTPAGPVEGACFPSASKGLVVTDSPSTTVFMTTNAGASWTKVFSRPGGAVRASLNCANATTATLRLDFFYTQNSASSTTWAAMKGWQGSWQMVAGNHSTSQSVAGARDGSVSPASVYVTPAGLVGAGVTATGSVQAFKASAGPQGLSRAAVAKVGSIAPPAGGAIGLFQYSAGALFVSRSTGYVFASSDESGLVVLATTTDGGKAWHVSKATIPAT